MSPTTKATVSISKPFRAGLMLGLGLLTSLWVFAFSVVLLATAMPSAIRALLDALGGKA